MKKAIAFMLAASALLICFSSCSATPALEELTQATRIEIRAHSKDLSYTDHVISDKESVESFCDTFSSLKLKKVKITKPLMIYYEVKFFKGSEARAFKSFSVESSDVLDTDEGMFKITSGVDLLEYISDAIENADDN